MQGSQARHSSLFIIIFVLKNVWKVKFVELLVVFPKHLTTIPHTQFLFWGLMSFFNDFFVLFLVYVVIQFKDSRTTNMSLYP